VTSNPGAKMGLRRPPYAFTEQGVAMLSSVLNSERAVQMNILIIRAFVKLREFLATHKDLADRIEKIEATQGRHASVINLLAQEIKQLKRLPAAPPKWRIGLRTERQG
jgi:phage regulator Rha-like protein